MSMLTQQAGIGTPDSVFLTSSQVSLMLAHISKFFWNTLNSVQHVFLEHLLWSQLR